MIPLGTDALFKERVTPVVTARVRRTTATRVRVEVFRFYNGIQTDEQQPCRPRTMGFLGLLPNQLRLLLKTHVPDHQSAARDISQLIFWEGYQVWKHRCKLMEKLKKDYDVQLSKKEAKCRNPFHFLQRSADLGVGRITDCACYRFDRPSQPTYDLRALIRSQRIPSRDDRPGPVRKTKKGRNSTCNEEAYEEESPHPLP